MGNSCTCITDEQKDREEFRSGGVAQNQYLGSAVSGRKNREDQIIMIQKNVRGRQARKLYATMKEEAKGGNERQVFLNEDDINLNPMIKVRYHETFGILNTCLGYK